MALPSKNRHAALALASMLLLAREAAADEPRLEAAEDVKDCPSGADLRRAIASHLGKDDFDREGAPRVVLQVRRTPDGALAGDVTMVTRDGSTSTRTIHSGDTCADVVRGAALSIGLALAQDAEPKPAPAPPPPPPPPRAEGEGAAPPVREDRAAVTAAALTAVGLLPRAGPGAGLAARVRVSEAIWMSARGFWLPETSMPGDQFALRLYGGGLGACVEPFGGRRIAPAACGHLAVGAYEVRPVNVPVLSDANEAYVAATLSVGARAHVFGPVHVEAFADAHLPFARPTFLSATCPAVGFEPPYMALSLWLGAGISFR